MQLVGAYMQGPAAAQQQQKTSELGKPDGDLFIARTDTRHATPASQSDSTQLKAGNFL